MLATGALGIVEVAVSVRSFVNVELHSQGWYAVRFRIPQDPYVKAVWPSSVLDSELGDKSGSGQSWVEEAGSFRTRIFRIKYCYEEIDIGETFSFTLYVLRAPGFESLCCHVEVELLFMDADIANPAAVPAQFHLKPAAKDVIRIARFTTSVCEHYSCTFDADHFGLINLALLTTLHGFTTQEALDSALRSTARHHSGIFSRPSFMAKRASRTPSGFAERDSGGSSAIKPRAGDVVAGMGTISVVLVPEDSLHHRSFTAMLQAELLAEPCGPRSKGSMTSLTSALDLPLSADMRPRFLHLYDSLLGSAKRSEQRLVSFLRSLPKMCYTPQTFEVLRALLGTTTAQSRQNGTGSPRHKTAALATVNTWSDVPADASTFLTRLPSGISTSSVLQYLDAALQRQRHETAVDWQVLLWVLRASLREVHAYLKCCWELEQPAQVAPWLCTSCCVTADPCTDSQQRRSLRSGQPAVLPAVQRTSFWDHPAEHPILFIDDSMARARLSATGSACSAHGGQSPGAVQSSGGMKAAGGGSRSGRDHVHVVVFVHGFQGTSTDLCLIKGHLNLLYPYLECFSSKINENNTHDSLQDLGARLAREVVEYLQPFAASQRRPLRHLSFVGHSIGNLILRSALATPELQPYLHMLHLYISVSGPHLGFLYSSNAVLDTGMSVLKSVSGKGKCLHQLSFSDAPNVRDCFLYKLAQHGALSRFKWLMLVSSLQDRYVPHHSSRITMCPAARGDTKRGSAYREMLDSLLKGVGEDGGTKLLRIEVEFDLKSKAFSLSKLINNHIGRQAHIEFIESDVHARFLAWTVHKYKMLPEAEHAWL